MKVPSLAATNLAATNLAATVFGITNRGITNLGLTILAASSLFSIGCADRAATPGEAAAGAPNSVQPAPTAEQDSPLDAWWDELTVLCGTAYAGELTSEDSADAEMAGQPMTMHVRRCEEQRLEIPFHIGTNRSRTWVITRTDQGLHLQHDHRHEDGTEDDLTLYGGRSDSPGSWTGNVATQHFPADEFSLELFEAHGLTASKANVWTMEIVPGERFSYILRRPGRHFQADFDLTRAVDPPPAPWGHD